jgi:OOP family OmpA-OmpF porin
MLRVARGMGPAGLEYLAGGFAMLRLRLTTGRVLMAVLLAPVLVWGCATPLPAKAPYSVSPIQMGGGQWRVPDQVVVVTDGSGSMYREKTFPDAKALSQTLVAAMPDPGARSKSGRGYSAGLLGFGGNDRLVHPLSSFDRGAMSRAAGDLMIMGDIDGFGGETPLHSVLGEVAASLEGQRGPAAVVVFSDGKADRPDESLAMAQAMIDTYPSGVCLHTVHVGQDPEGAALLSKLAGLSSCGSSTEASSLGSGSAVSRFASAVFTGPAPAPPQRPAEVGERIVLRGVNFDFDKADIRPDAAVILDEAASILNRNSRQRVRVAGYTDSTGPEAYNQVLSERRADSVKRYLVGQGVSGSRLETVGYGESNPIASNSTRDGRALNRRVELQVLE